MLTYESENWTIIRPDKRKIESAGMRIIRLVAGFNLIDEKRSTDTSRIENIKFN